MLACWFNIKQKKEEKSGEEKSGEEECRSKEKKRWRRIFIECQAKAMANNAAYALCISTVPGK